MQTVEIRFKGNRRDFFQWADLAEPLRLKEAVLVEAERGLDCGRVHSAGAAAEKKCGGCSTGCGTDGNSDSTPEKLKRVVRRATQEEIKTANELRRTEEDVRHTVIGRVKAHNLVMKVSDTEWQWDRNKLTVYFTADKRVDFRALVRDLAAQFRTRIELRQIGVRDEAARLSGVGRCGREYCCSTWLTELSPVNLGLAKDQRLSLNPQQISGGCGRLLCCLKYEHDFYIASRKRFPKEGRTLRTVVGEEKVVAVDIFRERVFLRGEGGTRILPLVQLREEIDAEPGNVAEREEPLNPVVATAQPAAQPDAPPAADPGAEAEERAQGRKRRRRRGRRGRGGGLGGNPSPEA